MKCCSLADFPVSTEPSHVQTTNQHKNFMIRLKRSMFPVPVFFFAKIGYISEKSKFVFIWHVFFFWFLGGEFKKNQGWCLSSLILFRFCYRNINLIFAYGVKTLWHRCSCPYEVKMTRKAAWNSHKNDRDFGIYGKWPGEVDDSRGGLTPHFKVTPVPQVINKDCQVRWKMSPITDQPPGVNVNKRFITSPMKVTLV